MVQKQPVLGNTSTENPPLQIGRKNGRGSNQGNSFSGVGGYKKVWAVLKPVGSSGILAVPKLPLDSDSDDIIPIPAVL